MEANNLTEESAKKLRVGQKLVIPAKDAKGGKAVKSGKQEKSAKRAANTVYYGSAERRRRTNIKGKLKGE